jgi:hypothetical protein
MGIRVEALVSRLRPASLESIDERASLQRREDNKYLVPLDRLETLMGALRDDHDVLEIDGRRIFEYESTYFDTPELRCFRDHVHDRRPRYKARTRCYVTTGDCYFEVKVKQTEGETVKQSIDYDPDDRQIIHPAARELLWETLESCQIEPPDREPDPALVTRFRRVTVAARERPERVTIDLGIELDAPGGDTATIAENRAVVEAKTPDGDGRCDELLREAGIEPVSLSKYRLGIGLLVAQDEDPDYGREAKALFSTQSARV